MVDFLSKLLDTSDFPARWYCGRWSDAHGWLHILSDLAIFAAYMAIPALIAIFVVRRRDVPFPRVLILFCCFILACGTTHLMEAVIFWQPMYRLAGALKFTTAVISWVTVATLVPTIPSALAMRSSAQLEAEVARRTMELENQRAALMDAETRLAETNTALERQNARLGRFVYTVSHDLRAPLVTAAGFLGVLEEGLQNHDPDDVREAMERIRAANDQMRTLIDELLEISRIGRVDDAARFVAIAQAASEVCELLSGDIAARGASVRVLEGPPVWVNPARLRQVLQNLVENALKYGLGEDDKTIEIGSVAQDGAVEVFVRDRGPGVADADRKRIFEVFQRASAASTGTGIGLAIVQRIAEHHGGDAWVMSREGGGAEFRVRFPAPDARRPPGGGR